MTARAWSSNQLSLFGHLAAAFLVPAKTSSGVARSRGPGRPLGRRHRRLALEGGEHGGRLVSVGTTTRTPPVRRASAILVSVLALLVDGSGVALSAPVPTTPVEAQIETAVIEASRRYSLPVGWIRAVMKAESNGEVRAVSAKGAMGLMQIMPATWEELRGQLELGPDPFDVRDNVLAGAFYLRQLLDRFGRHGFLAAYNAGPGRYAQHLTEGRALPLETRAYVARLAPVLLLSEPPSQPEAGQRTPGWRLSGIFVDGASDRQEQQAPSVFASDPSEFVR
ncbi:MAG: lytic transglycosylase domain-containing protein [Pseudomonadota bacterium]